MNEKKVFYYSNELEDEFSSAKIKPIEINKNYKYSHNFLWDFCSFLLQNIFSIPVRQLYLKIKFGIKYVGKEKFKECKNTGYFIFVNHTQEYADTSIPSIANYPKRNFFIVNPENVSMKGLKTLVKMLGAIPVPGDVKAFKNFLKKIEETINKKHSITIYPEAHIWPYYTKIRPFKDTSFKYAVNLNKPIFTLTNTYHKDKNKVKIISYIDGPFYPNSNMDKKEAQKELRDKAYDIMTKRAEHSTYEHIKYIKK